MKMNENKNKSNKNKYVKIIKKLLKTKKEEK